MELFAGCTLEYPLLIVEILASAYGINSASFLNRQRTQNDPEHFELLIEAKIHMALHCDRSPIVSALPMCVFLRCFPRHLTPVDVSSSESEATRSRS